MCIYIAYKRDAESLVVNPRENVKLTSTTVPISKEITDFLSFLRLPPPSRHSHADVHKLQPEHASVCGASIIIYIFENIQQRHITTTPDVSQFIFKYRLSTQYISFSRCQRPIKQPSFISRKQNAKNYVILRLSFVTFVKPILQSFSSLSVVPSEVIRYAEVTTIS